MSRLRAFLNLASAWPLCLVNAAIAYLTVAGLLLILSPDIAWLIVNRVPTSRLILTMATVFLFLNMLLVLTHATSLFIVKRESIMDGLRRNGKRLIKGFALLSLFNLAGLSIMVLASHTAVPSASLAQDAFRMIVMSYGAGLIASFLSALPLVWLITSLAGEGFPIGLGRLLAAVALAFLMLTILSTYGLPGLFIDFTLIPTIVSLTVQFNEEKIEDSGVRKARLSWSKGKSMGKKTVAITFSILILSAEAPFNSMLYSIGGETRFGEDRLKELVSKAIAEGWSNGELAEAIKSDPGLSMLSNYDLSSISIERDDAGNVEVTIPLNAMGYAIYRKTGNKTTFYDVYSQSGSGEVNVGDKRYVLSGYRSEEKTYGPFETLDEALAKENEVKKHANATRIVSNTALNTELREVTRVETRYAIVPTVRVVKYDVKGEFDTYEAAQNHLFSHPGMFGIAEIREVEKQVWVYSYILVFERETRDRHEAMMVARDENNHVVEEVREKITVYVFDKHTPLYLGPIYLGHYHSGKERIRRSVFEKMLETGMVKTGRDLWGLGSLFYYYASEGDAATRLYKKGEEEEEGDVTAWKIYRKIDTSHYETRKVYRVVVPNGYEERKVSINELPRYVKGFQSKEDAEAAKQVVEPSLKKGVESMGMTYVSCGIESYEETVKRTETAAKEVKQYYVVATFLKPVYDVYELQTYYRVWNETRYEERWGWVFKGYVNKTPETYDMSAWIYSPEVVNWTSKTYLGIVTEQEAKALMGIDPHYVAEKHNTTTITKEISYYDVYNATWRLLYHYYKYVVHPTHEYVVNGNVSSGGGWVFESLGDANGEVCSSTYRSSPSSLRIVSGNGRGAWRQTFYYDAGGSSPILGFWYKLSGGGAIAIKKPDGSARVFALGGSSGWARFLRDSGDVFSQAGYYAISFVASENSELIVDDVSVHVGGYGEWVYRGDVENRPENVPSDEKYEAFYRIEDKRLIGTFEESVANQYPTPPYIKEFKKKETASYTVDLYKLYYLEGGVVRYRVFHWEQYQVPIAVRKEESGAEWVKVETGVETDTGGRILVELNVPENVVKAKYSDPTKYYLVPKVVDSGEALELVCETLDESLARRCENEGYVVNSARVSAGNPIRFSVRVLRASVEKNELGMLGKQNILHVAVANPTGDTLTYQVLLEAENEEMIEEAQAYNQAFPSPEAIKRTTSVPVAEPNSWLLVAPPGGASYPLGFTTWVKKTEGREYGSYSVNTAYWPGGQVGCSFIVRVLRNGRLVAKQRVLETFENFDVGRTIARHPFETISGFLVGFGTTAVITAISIANPLVGTTIALAGLALSSMNAISIYMQTGNAKEALTYSPLGIIVAPIRALADPTMDDDARASTIGAMIGVPLGMLVGREIALDIALLRMPEELRGDPGVYSLLYRAEENYGTPTASALARNIGKLYSYLDTPDPKGLVTMILSDALASRQNALYIASMLEWASRMSDEFLKQHAGSIMEWLGSPLLRGKLGSLLQLSPDEALHLSQTVGGDFQSMLRMAEFKQALEQFAKLGPDTVRVLSWSPEGIEVGVEKSLAGQLYPGIQRGTVVEFEFARGSIVLKGFLTYAEEKALGDSKYLVFSFKAEERIPYVFELLKEDLQAIPGQQAEKSFGFNAFSLSNGKLSMDKGNLGIDGAVRFSNGMVLRLEDPSVRLVPSEDPLETGRINEMLLGGRIGGISVIVGEEGSIQAFHGGSYLPAVVMANPLGLQLGLLAKPSGEILIISSGSLLGRGIQDLGLLNVVYPNGETSTVFYTGGDLQIPALSYSSGAFVSVQAIETKVIWTSIGQKEFYGQVLSTEQLAESVLGKDFAEELVKTLLLSGLTDTQALDIANGLVKNVEWLKGVSEEKRVELVKKIAEYVKKGETAEEAIERVKKESEQYFKDVENAIYVFCDTITDAQLAAEVRDFLKHVLSTMGPDAARWLLNLLSNIYYGTSKSGGNANGKLRSVVEKFFMYPESKMHGCALASTKIAQLMKLEESALMELLEEYFREISERTTTFELEGKRITLTKGSQATLYSGEFEKIGPGAYKIVISWRWDEGEKGTVEGTMSFSITRSTKSDYITIPARVGDDILDSIKNAIKEATGDEKVEVNNAKVSITKVEFYDLKRVFSKIFSGKGATLELDPDSNTVKIDGKSFKITLSEVAISHEDGRAYRDGRLECMNEYSGNTLTLTFYEDGEVRIKFGVSPHTISEIKFNNATGLIAIKYIEGEEVSEARYSLNFKSLGEQLGKHDLASLQTKRSLEGQTGVSLNRILFELLGYQARKELRGRIGKDVSGDKRVVLLVHFALEGNKEKVAYCGNEKLEVDVPENAKEITTIEIVPFKDLMDIKKSVIKVIDNPSDWNKGKLGEAIANNKMDDVFNKFAEKFGLSEEELHQLKDKSKVIPRGDPGEPDFERIAIDIITIKGKTFKAGDRIAVIEVKYVSSPENVEEFKCAIGDAKDEVNTRFESSEWTAPYGIIFVVSWPPSQILGDEPMPSNVGGYNNPYIDALENPKIKG